MKVCIYGQDHMTKMAVMAINSKITLKKICFESRWPTILKLGMKHQGTQLYKVYINHDPGLTLTFSWQVQHRSPVHLNRENC